MLPLPIPAQTHIRPKGFPPVAETLPSEVEKLVAALQPEKIILFGPYAYGTPTPDSVVGLLIIMKTHAKRVDRNVLVSNILNPRRFPVDFLVKTPKEILEEREIKENIFLRDILTHGKTLYIKPRTSVTGF